MLTTEQRVANYIAQNRKDGRPNPEKLTPRQTRRVNQKLGKGINKMVQNVATLEAKLDLAASIAETRRSTDALKAAVESGDRAVQESKWNEHSVTELRNEAKARGLKGYSKMKKADLVALITG